MKLSSGDMEILTEHRERLSVELEMLQMFQQKQEDIEIDIRRVEDTLNIIDKIIDGVEVVCE